MPRGHYIKKSDADEKKAKIKKVYTDGGNWQEFAKNLGVKKSTAYDWVNSSPSNDKTRGGNRHQKIGPEQRDFIEYVVESNPRITLKDLTAMVKAQFNFGSLSSECVRLHLQGMMYTLKQIRFEPETANKEENKIKRKAYATKLIKYQSQQLPILSIWTKQAQNSKTQNCLFPPKG